MPRKSVLISALEENGEETTTRLLSTKSDLDAKVSSRKV